MARSHVAVGGTAFRCGGWVAASVLNKQSRTADNGLSSSVGVRRDANNSSP
jgi:hypothetical protein